MDSGNFFVFYLLFNHISAQNSVIVFIRLFLLLLFMYVFQGCFNSQPMGNYKDETKCKTLN